MKTDTQRNETLKGRTITPYTTYTYKEMCQAEGYTRLQRGMIFHQPPRPSIILMSRKQNAPYRDRLMHSRRIIEYRGHNATGDPLADQPTRTKRGTRTPNGAFIDAATAFKEDDAEPLYVHVYEKIYSGVWLFRGPHRLIDYRAERENERRIFTFFLLPQTPLLPRPRKTPRQTIPAEVKKEVYQRDGGRCAICGAESDLHFDHIVPLAKGGAATSVDNLRLLCGKHNRSKGARIE